MSVSETAICNSALAKIGADRIVSLDDNSREAKLCKEQYYKIRDELLRSHPWNFAIIRASLAALATSPAWGYSYQYQVPADCIRILAIEWPDESWVREGDMILSDLVGLNVTYISSNITPGNFDACFSEALATKLAHDICYSIVQSVTLKSALMQEFDRKIREARSFDAQEGKAPIVRANLWNLSRRQR